MTFLNWSVWKLRGGGLLSNFSHQRFQNFCRSKSASRANVAPFGASVWGAGYIVLPAMKLYEPIWAYDATTLANGLSAHLVYGLATAAAMRGLST